MIEWGPVVSEEMASAAWPVPSRLAVPKAALPSVKATVPVGVPTPESTDATVAVRVTDWPKTEGLVDDDRAVVVGAWFAVWMRGLAVAEDPKLVSPP